MDHPPKRQRLSKRAARWQPRSGGADQTIPERIQFVHQALDAVAESRHGQSNESPSGHSRKVSEGKGTIFHRRQAGGLTVTVQGEVVPNGSTAAIATLPTVPAEPTFPESLTVPAVPVASLTVPTVPSYPFTTTTTNVVSTGTPTPSASAGTSPSEGMIGQSATSPGSTQVVLSPPPTPSPSSPAVSTFPTSANSTSSESSASAASVSTDSVSSTFPPNENITTSAFTTFSDGVVGYTTIDLGPLSTTTSSIPAGMSGIPSDISAAQTSRPSTTLAASSAESSSTTESSASASATQSTVPNGVGGASANPQGPSPTTGTTGAPSGAASNTNDRSMPTPVIVGGAVGGVAGVAVLLLLALLFLRWYKRRGQTRQPLAGDDGESAAAAGPMEPMTQSSSRFPPVAAATALMHRFSTPRTPPAPPQRGFEKVAGRKLPSQFSGAAGPDSAPDNPFDDPVPTNIPADKSFYRDSEGIFGLGGETAAAGAARAAAATGSSTARDFVSDPSTAPGSAAAAAPEEERFLPGPARTPVIHPGGPYSPAVMGPPLDESDSPATLRTSTPLSMTAPVGTLGRSHPSFDGSRGSRFTENVE
ncbi:MAG: hypothetical protein M1820_010068 [Bogoriella megaspora]|nr:MAG: hypothetical protein M1820_010068 [Bogoriella megaspora]